MEPFIDLLQQLHRGVPMEFWPEMLRDIRVYAEVVNEGHRLVLWRQVRVAQRHLHIGMAQQFAYGVEVDASHN